MRRVPACVKAGIAILAATVVLCGVGRPDLALGFLALVAFVLGMRYLLGVMRDALPGRPSALVMLALLTMGIVAMAQANPEVWPLFVVGYPSCASVAVEAWLRLYDVVAGDADVREGARERRQPRRPVL